MKHKVISGLHGQYNGNPPNTQCNTELNLLSLPLWYLRHVKATVSACGSIDLKYAERSTYFNGVTFEKYWLISL